MTASEFNQCVEQYADGMYRFVLKNIRISDMARDIVQDTFEKLWMKVSEVRFDTAKSYLYTMAYNLMIDRLRREKFETDFEQIEEHRYLTETPYNDLRSVLDQALNRLPEIQRSVVLLRDYEGYSYEEIGEITGLNPAQVKVYIYRARVALKEYIGSMDNLV